VRELFRSRGYVVFKSSDSAVADVIAVRSSNRDIVGGSCVECLTKFPVSRGYLIECKANLGSPFMNFRAPERAALRAVAEQAGLDPLLVHWPPRGALREIPANEWPDDERRVA
jgi:hypothetical protein